MNHQDIIRSAVVADQRPLNAMLKETSVHRHLDWREPLGWIGSPSFLVLEREGKLIGALVCPPEPPGAAWLRLFMYSPGVVAKDAWQALWQAASSRLPQHTTAAALAMLDQMTSLLEASGFAISQTLVMLEKNDADISGMFTLERGFTIRTLVMQDLPAVADTDAASFVPLWQNSLPDLTRAFSRAYLATVAEHDGRVVGYQICTRTSIGLHLARLAVRPDSQGYGIGKALVKDLISHADQRNIQRFTVNTQSDNSASLMLYKKLGFLETGERYPVYTLQL